MWYLAIQPIMRDAVMQNQIIQVHFEDSFRRMDLSSEKLSAALTRAKVSSGDIILSESSKVEETFYFQFWPQVDFNRCFNF